MTAPDPETVRNASSPFERKECTLAIGDSRGERLHSSLSQVVSIENPVLTRQRYLLPAQSLSASAPVMEDDELPSPPDPTRTSSPIRAETLNERKYAVAFLAFSNSRRRLSGDWSRSLSAHLLFEERDQHQAVPLERSMTLCDSNRHPSRARCVDIFCFPLRDPFIDGI